MSNENEEVMTMGAALMKLGNSKVISEDCCKKVRGENRHTKSGSFNLVQFRSKSVQLRSKGLWSTDQALSGRPTKGPLNDRPEDL